MINWTEVNKLQDQKLSLEVQLSEIKTQDNTSIDEINELKSEILYLDKKLEKMLGSKELRRLKELKKKKLGIEQNNINNYFALKKKYKKISSMKIAYTNFINMIENLYVEKQNINSRVKVKN